MVIANDDDSGIPDPEAHAKAMQRRWSGYMLGYGGEEEDTVDFSWRYCDGCGSTLGGARFAAHAVKNNSQLH
jgi:hypothetical protein